MQANGPARRCAQKVYDISALPTSWLGVYASIYAVDSLVRQKRSAKNVLILWPLRVKSYARGPPGQTEHTDRQRSRRASLYWKSDVPPNSARRIERQVVLLRAASDAGSRLMEIYFLSRASSPGVFEAKRCGAQSYATTIAAKQISRAGNECDGCFRQAAIHAWRSEGCRRAGRLRKYLDCGELLPRHRRRAVRRRCERTRVSGESREPPWSCPPLASHAEAHP